MKKVSVAVACVVLAVVCSELIGWIDPHRWLALELCLAIGGWGRTVSVLLIPALFIFVPPKRPGRRSYGLRIAGAVLLSWWAQIVFRMQFSLPALLERASQEDDYRYDGIGMNAAILAMGWLPPLLVTLLMVGIMQSILAICRRFKGGAAKRLDGRGGVAPEEEAG